VSGAEEVAKSLSGAECYAVEWLPISRTCRGPDNGGYIPNALGSLVVNGLAEPLFNPLRWRLTSRGLAVRRHLSQPDTQRGTEGR
jgi:hypothetical protein